MNEATYYDNIISLGGNCSAASQLKQRGLRLQAMPFDYFFLRNEEDLKKAIFALKNNFENCFLKTRFKSQRSIFTINKIKKGYQIILLNFINTILRFNIYLFGLRLDFCIGKLRD